MKQQAALVVLCLAGFAALSVAAAWSHWGTFVASSVFDSKFRDKSSASVAGAKEALGASKRDRLEDRDEISEPDCAELQGPEGERNESSGERVPSPDVDVSADIRKPFQKTTARKSEVTTAKPADSATVSKAIAVGSTVELVSSSAETTAVVVLSSGTGEVASPVDLESEQVQLQEAGRDLNPASPAASPPGTIPKTEKVMSSLSEVSEAASGLVAQNQRDPSPGAKRIHRVAASTYVWIPKAGDRAGFWIGKTEVSHGAYLRFAEEFQQTELEDLRKTSKPGFPKTEVKWKHADFYCRKWVGGSLPTHEQWQAAAGGSRSGKYPWGDLHPSCEQGLRSLAVFKTRGCRGPRAIDSFEASASYGLHHIVGNVAEWGLAEPGAEEAPIFGGHWRSSRKWLEIDREPARHEIDGSSEKVGFRCVLTGSRPDVLTQEEGGPKDEEGMGDES